MIRRMLLENFSLTHGLDGKHLANVLEGFIFRDMWMCSLLHLINSCPN